METFLMIVGTVTLVCAAMYLIMFLGAVCEGRRW